MLVTARRLTNLESLATAKTVQPRQFCRKWFNATEEDEQVYGYRAKCVKLLSQIIGVEPHTISSKWGAGIDFEKMPEQYQRTLAYANSLREIYDNVSQDGHLMEVILDRLKKAP